MAYHSEGAFNWAILYDMPISWRTFYLHKLQEIKHKEAEATKKASGGNIPRPSMPRAKR